MRGLLRTALIASAVLLMVCGRGRAALLNLRLELPILVTFDQTVTYDANGPGGHGLLTATATFDPWGAWTALQDYTTDGVSSTTYLGSFSLTAEIDKTAKTSVSGSVEVWSDTTWDGSLDTMQAQSSDLQAFGFAVDDQTGVGTGVFNFYFLNGTGPVTSPIGEIVVILDAMEGGFDASFTTNWQNSGFGKADIPEPASLGLFFLIGLGIGGRRLRRLK